MAKDPLKTAMDAVDELSKKLGVREPGNFGPGNRGSVYGPFMENAKVSQTLKAFFRSQPGFQKMQLDQREAFDQTAIKMARILTGDPNYLDNWDDIAGYAKIVTDRMREELELTGGEEANDTDKK